MDTRTFDALTRRVGAQRNRRAALKTFAAGLLGLGIARDAAAQVSTERANCGQPCRNVNNTNCNGNDCCNAGLICSGSGNDAICVRKPDTRNSCNRNIDCTDSLELCRNGRCRNQSTCNRCRVAGDCPSGEVCRNGTCGECRRDRQCPGRQVCRNGRCKRVGGRSCNRNNDCPRKKKCRRGRCVRK